MKVCNVIELPAPTSDQIMSILKLNNIEYYNSEALKEIHGDLRKLNLVLTHKSKLSYQNNYENYDVKIFSEEKNNETPMMGM